MATRVRRLQNEPVRTLQCKTKKKGKPGQKIRNGGIGQLQNAHKHEHYSQKPIPAYIMMELVLEVNEAIIACFGESNSSQNSTNNMRSNLRCLKMETNLFVKKKG